MSRPSLLNWQTKLADFDNPDIDRPITEDAGRVQIKNTRQRYFLSPRVEFQLTDKTSFGGIADYVAVSFDNMSGELTDYSDINLEAQLSYQASKWNVYSLRIPGSKF